MLLFLKNILPRIERFSKDLSRIEVFVDKPWVLIDDENNSHEYTFLRDGRLILALNGVVQEGRWELLPTGKLLIDRPGGKLLLEHRFIDDALLFLKISGDSASLPFVLINTHIIRDKNPVRYLQKLEAEKNSLPLFATSTGELVIPKNAVTRDLDLGTVLHYSDGSTVSGEIQSMERKDVFYVVTDGKVEKKFFRKSYSLNGNTIVVRQATNNEFYAGDIVENPQSLKSEIVQEILNRQVSGKVIVDENGVIGDIKSNFWWFGVILIVILVFFIVIAVLKGGE